VLRNVALWAGIRSGEADGGRRSPITLSVLGDNRRVDSAAHVEVGGETQKARLQGRREEVRNLVRDRLVEGAAIAEGPDVELERLELDAELVGNVLEFERCEIRLARARAQARELRDAHADRIVATRLRI